MTDTWFDVPADDFTYGGHTSRIIRDAVDDYAPAFANDLPGRQPWRVSIGRTADALVVRWQETGPSFVSTTSAMSENEALEILAAAERRRTYAEFKEVGGLGALFGTRSLLLILDIVDSRMDGQVWADQVIDWLNDEPARKAEANNMLRVQAAIPTPPEWDIGVISAACWVVESEEGLSQGTAFALEGVGFITCHHVVHASDGKLHPDLEMFHVDDPSVRFPATIVCASDVLDLAVISSAAPPRGQLKRSNQDDVPPMAHVAVCGFPNFRFGSSCSVSPGTIVATRMSRGGVRRLLTNAGIVAGMSGGPAVSEGREVIGICANGAPYMQDVRDTEDQAIIPIAALNLLQIL
ncbi:hypothetical protein ASE69_20125 [Sphingomonas sp. Leaf208]|uniref:S1 family peptidase n=1 Tax=Sphingomonas sp. Leaf208 TaxID=1735679 RepID=UPI0006F6F2EA|nr:serine protease [Sphingomonas sp. Leaf208]KQM52126.1 hypothetical protein ASE69_20125 [Sphingomonas sp. Leaf208]